ncbi:MAG: hypothetical protein WCT77_13630, partial [Bacteroidota bacterium]
MKQFFTCFIFIIITSYFSSFAIDEEIIPITGNEMFAFRLNAGYQANIYQADFSNFQGSIDCGRFLNGNGWGPAFSFGIEMPVMYRGFFGLEFGYSDRSGEFSLQSIIPVRDDISSSGIADIFLDNTLKTDLLYIEIQPVFRYELIPKLFNGPFSVFGGFNFSFPMSGYFTQKEAITFPDNAVFKNS